MKELGGYFEIEFSNVEMNGIHSSAIHLNTARNCFEYIVLSRGYKKVYLPYYTCEVLLEPLNKHGISYEFYHINQSLEPVDLPKIDKKDAFLYTNYFGIKGAYVREVAGYTSNFIVDNSQALFEAPLPEIDTFYSLRKFTGVPDGAFLYTPVSAAILAEPSSSADRVSHLYKRKENNTAAGYISFKANDAALSDLPISLMSESTQAFLKTYDFEKNRAVRERNFFYLHAHLQQINQLLIKPASVAGPLCYPLLTNKVGLKDYLIAQKIFIPTYWPNVREWVNDNQCFEKQLVDQLICLPVDQRYDLKDMERIMNQVLN